MLHKFLDILASIAPVAIALIAAALLVLQTRVTFKLDTTGRWGLQLEKDERRRNLILRFLEYVGNIDVKKGRNR